MERRAIANAGQRLVVLADGLAPPGIRHARLGHQITLVAGVGEDAAAKGRAVLSHKLGNRRVLLRDAVLLAKTVLQEYSNARLFHELVEHCLRDVRFKVPLDVAAVLRANTLEELERVPANHFL